MKRKKMSKRKIKKTMKKEEKPKIFFKKMVTFMCFLVLLRKYLNDLLYL